jgi:hypothetical protein
MKSIWAALKDLKSITGRNKNSTPDWRVPLAACGGENLMRQVSVQKSKIYDIL